MSKFFTVKLAAPNDTNGNPRRVFVTYSLPHHGIVGVRDEGYSGSKSIANLYHRAAWQGVVFQITPAEYREWIQKF